jgi:hypothetical protein
MAHGKDTEMDTDQRSARGPILDRAPSKTEIQQLLMSDKAVLAGSERRYPLVDSRLRSHYET